MIRKASETFWSRRFDKAQVSDHPAHLSTTWRIGTLSMNSLFKHMCDCFSCVSRLMLAVGWVWDCWRPCKGIPGAEIRCCLLNWESNWRMALIHSFTAVKVPCCSWRWGIWASLGRMLLLWPWVGLRYFLNSILYMLLDCSNHSKHEGM